ncbi:MAG: ATPase [Lysobacterales bacterium]|jgi:SpoVK/Ycf46/Vps4 family AAA+-type ATPase|nr:MAG: ATPase [Xanthomonadales bacterium]
MFDHHDLAALIRADHGLLLIESKEEDLVVESFRRMLQMLLRPLWKWSLTRGLERLDLDLDQPAAEGADSTQALRAIHAAPEPGIYLLLDFHPYLRYAMNVRLMREIVMRKGTAAHTLVLIAPKIELPEELKPHALALAPALPGEERLGAILREEAFAWSKAQGGRRVEIDAKVVKALIKQLLGLSEGDARRLIRQLLADGIIGEEDLPALAQAKYRLLAGERLLHFEMEPLDPDGLAGMRRLKRWLALRRAAFMREPGSERLDPPRGVLLLGVQGAGKSSAARLAAAMFRVPLLRMDIAALYDKYHGESERRLREALAQAEQMAPCVLWIDEIEKALATSDADGGVSRRVLGLLLTWMAERKKPVFLFATANAVHELPPELLRKGRFDEIFFVDLPDAEARAEIFRIHLARRGLDPAAFDLAALAEASAGFSGAEIEQAVVSALYAAHAERRRPDQALLLDELAATRPLSVLMAEKITALRAWAAERTVPAD